MRRDNAKVRSAILIGLKGYVNSRGADFNRLLTLAGIGEETAANPLNLVLLDSVNRVFEAAAREVDDPAFGINAALAFNPGGSGLLGGLVLSAGTARQAMQVFGGFLPTFMTGVEAGYAEREGISYAHWSLPDTVAPPRSHLTEFMGAAVVARLRLALGSDWRPLAVEFERRAPEPDQYELLAAISSVFGERIRFGCPRNVLIFDQASLARPMPNADPVMFAVLGDLAKRWLSELKLEVDIVEGTRNEIAARLKQGKANLEEIAKALNMPQRTLQWQLESAGTSFEAVLSETRSAIGLRLIQNTDRPLMQIAYDLGYSDQSAFTRACRRWFGKSPRELRKSNAAQT